MITMTFVLILFIVTSYIRVEINRFELSFAANNMLCEVNRVKLNMFKTSKHILYDK